MSSGEWYYLGMVIVAFVLFGIVLAYATHRAPGGGD